LQWPQVTLNWALCKVGTVIVGGTAGVGARLIIRLLVKGKKIMTLLIANNLLLDENKTSLKKMVKSVKNYKP